MGANETSWCRYEPEKARPTYLDPYGAGSFAYSAKWQDQLFRQGHPAAFNPKFFYKIEKSLWASTKYPDGGEESGLKHPWCNMLTILSSCSRHNVGCEMLLVKPALEFEETPLYYRIASRPFGYDTVPEFIDLDKVSDLVPLGVDSDGIEKYTIDPTKQDGGRRTQPVYLPPAPKLWNLVNQVFYCIYLEIE